MSDLRRWRVNADVEAALLSRPIFDPSSLDADPPPIDLTLMAMDDGLPQLLDLEGADDVTLGWYGPRPRMPWEVQL